MPGWKMAKINRRNKQRTPSGTRSWNWGKAKNVSGLQSVPSSRHVDRRDNEKDSVNMLLRSSMVQPSTWLICRTEQGFQAREELHDAAELPVYLDVLHPGRAVADDAAISCSRTCTGSEQQTKHSSFLAMSIIKIILWRNCAAIVTIQKHSFIKKKKKYSFTHALYIAICVQTPAEISKGSFASRLNCKCHS